MHLHHWTGERFPSAFQIHLSAGGCSPQIYNSPFHLPACNLRRVTFGYSHSMDTCALYKPQHNTLCTTSQLFVLKVINQKITKRSNTDVKYSTVTIDSRQPLAAHSRYRRKSRDASIDDTALQWKDMVLYRNTQLKTNISTYQQQMIAKAVCSKCTDALWAICNDCAVFALRAARKRQFSYQRLATW